MDKKIEPSPTVTDHESIHADSWTSQVDDVLLQRFERAIH